MGVAQIHSTQIRMMTMKINIKQFRCRKNVKELSSDPTYIGAEDFMYTRNRAVKAFIMKITEEAARHNVSVAITKANSVYAKDGTAVCCGIFIPPRDDKHGIGRIRVAAGGQSLAEAVLSLAHEYIHMRQWVNKEKIYYSSDYLKLETNTEKRALSLMKKNGCSPRLMRQAQRRSSEYLRDLKSGVLVS